MSSAAIETLVADDREARSRAELAQGRGRAADAPHEIPAAGWWDVLRRVWDGIGKDRIFLVSAGASFYLLLALFPALAAFVSFYGFVADPRTVADHVAFLGSLLPSGGLEIIQDQLRSLASQESGALSFGFVTGLAVALWSANNGVKSIFEGLNVAYGEEEKRGFFRLNLVAFAFTLGAILIGIGLIVSVGVVPAALALLRLDGWTEQLIAFGRWPLLVLFVAGGLALAYRFGPSREQAKWRWLSWGAGIATLGWLAASWGFSYYLQNFADYNATYGSLGAVIGLMMWTWISVVIVLVGAELNAELEHQTARDSTIGAPVPMGSRGAYMADTLGEGADNRD